MERKNIGYLVGCIVLAIFYAVGRIGLGNEEYAPLFQKLVPYNLLLTAFVVFSFHKKWDVGFIISCIVIFIAGYLAELAGVYTGKIFGQYQYGESLGLKLFDVPVIIGLNWLVLVYCIRNVVLLLGIKNHLFLTSFIGGFMLVLLDFFLEPFAVKYDLWQWESNLIPFQNFVAWFVVAVAMLYFYVYRESKETQINPVAVFGYFLQLVFFC